MPHVLDELCIGCGLCECSCPAGAINLFFNKAHIDPQKCIGCKNCISICPQGAIQETILPEINAIKLHIQNLEQRIKHLSHKLDKFTMKCSRY